MTWLWLGCATPPPTAPPVSPPSPTPVEAPAAPAWERLPDLPPPVSPSGVPVAPCPETWPEGPACIPGGPTLLGSDAEHTCNQSENRRYATRWGPPVPAWVSTFLLDRTEVTFAAYQACAKAGQCRPAKPAYRDFDRPDQPMVGLSWFQARDYCLAQGGRLPTEAEWERAARGPTGESTPFGEAVVTCEQAVILDGRGRSCGVPKQHGQPEKGRTFVVASTPPGRYGVYDLVGNAEEWVDDWFVVDRAACPECQGEDPRGPCPGQDSCPGHLMKMVKGGSWYWEPEHATGWHRRPHFPSNQPYHHFGFRCAYDLPAEEAR